MIPARHSKWAQALFHPYIMRLMRRQFHGFHLLGAVPEWPQEHLLVVLPNHASWWDGFFIHLLNERLWQRVPYLMMLEEQLAKNRFFSRLGVFSVRSQGFAAARRSLQYLQTIIRDNKPGDIFLCLFPQGELRPYNLRPLGYKPGILWLLRQASGPAAIVQLGIRIEYLEQQHADVFFEFAPLEFSDARMTDLQTLQAAHARLLERLQGRIIAGERGVNLLQGRTSINEKFQRWRHFRTGETT